MTVIINGTNGITSVNGTAAAPSVTGTDTDTGIVYGTNTLSLATGGTAGLTMDSSQNVGIGTSSPSTWATKQVIYNGQLTVTGGGYDGSFADSIFFGGNAEGTTYRNKISNSLSSNATNQQLKLSVASGSSTFVDALTMNGTGLVALSGGTKTASGVGIAFPATQSASTDANTLDDYEEGNWTPALEFGGASTGVSYNVRTGRYVKIGRQVFLQAYINLNSKGSATGNARISGIPFSPENTAGVYASVSTFWLDVVPTSGQMVNQMEPGVGAVVLYYYDGGATSRYRAVTEASINNNSTLYVCVNYNV